jgi:hypothetical protein
MCGEKRDPGDQRRSQCAREYSHHKRQRFPQLSAHQLFPGPRPALKLIR